MSDADTIKKDISRRMEGAIDVLHTEFAGLRSGRAATSLLEPVQVDAYGARMPLNQVSTVGVPEPRLLTVQVWDKSMVKAVEKAIRDAGLGLNPTADGMTVRVPVPPLNEERRLELSKIAGKYAEQARVSVRNVRRDGMDQLKKLEKDGDISQDKLRHEEKEVQKITDAKVRGIDDALAAKDQEIMQV